jgi:hypothetical protein
MSRLLAAPLLLLVLLAAPSHVRANKTLNDGGTYIHVKNGTNKTLSFELLVECSRQGVGKFDNAMVLEPGQTAIWRLKAGLTVGRVHKEGTNWYRVGLLGKDLSSGKQHQWGVLGGDGMHGREGFSETETDRYRNIVVQPVGKL